MKTFVTIDVLDDNWEPTERDIRAMGGPIFTHRDVRFRDYIYATEWVGAEYREMVSFAVLTRTGYHRHFARYMPVLSDYPSRLYGDLVTDIEIPLCKPGGFYRGLLTQDEFEFLGRMEFDTHDYSYEDIAEMLEVAERHDVPRDDVDMIRVAWMLARD